jgi:hypothetical protein
MKRFRDIAFPVFVAGFVLPLAACAPSSLGSPPAGERQRECQVGQTLVCRTRYPSRVEKEEEPGDEFCTCENMDRGLRY